MVKVTFSGPDDPKKDEADLKEKFAAKAKAAREKFFARKKAGAKPQKDHPTPLQRRMYSGRV